MYGLKQTSRGNQHDNVPDTMPRNMVWPAARHIRHLICIVGACPGQHRGQCAGNTELCGFLVEAQRVRLGTDHPAAGRTHLRRLVHLRCAECAHLVHAGLRVRRHHLRGRSLHRHRHAACANHRQRQHHRHQGGHRSDNGNQFQPAVACLHGRQRHADQDESGTAEFCGRRPDTVLFAADAHRHQSARQPDQLHRPLVGWAQRIRLGCADFASGQPGVRGLVQL